MAQGLADGLASLLLNLGVVAFLIHVGWPEPATPSNSQTISVDLVDRIPGEKGASGKEAAGEPAGQAAQAEMGTPKAAPPADHPEPQADRPAPQPQPKPEPTAEARPPAPPQPPPATPSPQPQPQPQPAAATPAPLEGPANDARPHLVEAPPDPHRAVTQLDKNLEAQVAPQAPETPKAAPAPAAPPQPKVLSTEDASEAAPSPVSEPEKPEPAKPEPTAEQKREAENTDKLAAILPFGPAVTTDPFNATLSGQGVAAAAQYRGAVYGAFKKANDVVEDARAKHLRGQAIVAFTIDDTGALVHVAVAVSSGNPQVDQMAVTFIQHAAPFPPPPPGAQRSFSPAIAFGADE